VTLETKATFRRRLRRFLLRDLGCGAPATKHNQMNLLNQLRAGRCKTARSSSEVTLLGSILPPPEKGNAVKILVEGQNGETSPEELGRFKLNVNGKAGDRVRLQIYVNGKMAYDDFQVLPGPIAVSLFKAN